MNASFNRTIKKVDFFALKKKISTIKVMKLKLKETWQFELEFFF